LDDSMVSSRRSRLHYGTSYATVYDETKHDVADRYWSPLWERWMVSDRMQWHIAKVYCPLLPPCTLTTNISSPTGHSNIPLDAHILPLHPQLPPLSIINRRRRINRVRL
jgi:hypothetical protein